MTTILRHCALIAAVSIASTIRAAELPTLSDSPEPFGFVVLDDMHYSRPDFEVRRVVAAIAADFKDGQPTVALVCETGDLVNGERPEGVKQLGKEEMKEELSFATKDQFRRPLFIAVGNHDKNAGATPFDEVVLPLLSRELGTPLSQRHDAFRHGNSCFIFLDYGDYSETRASMDYLAQRKFLEETIAQARTSVSDRFLFSATESEAQASRKATYGWQGPIISADVTTAATLGQPLSPMRLSFR